MGVAWHTSVMWQSLLLYEILQKGFFGAVFCWEDALNETHPHLLEPVTDREAINSTTVGNVT